MSTVRLRRLKADFANLQEYVRRHPRLRLLQHEGDPPERYQIEYRIRSLRMADGELQPVQSHIVEIALTQSYPRTPPQCRMLSPVFHPNIAPHAICVGDHWGAGESLQSIVARIGEMLAYQSYNVKSPLNGEAARWVDGNKDKLPLDAVSMLVEDERPANGATMAPSAPTGAGSGASSERGGGSVVGVSAAPSAQANGAAPSQPVAKSGESASPAPSPSPTTPTAVVACTHCQTAYSVAAEFIGRKVRCRKCMQVFVAAAPEG
jgi:predicted Zn finger-like uncharacterized protein